MKKVVLFFLLVTSTAVTAQDNSSFYWLPDGKSFAQVIDGQIMSHDPETGESKLLVSRKQLTPAGEQTAIFPEKFSLSASGRWLLIYTNSAKVWRYNTRGDYCILNLENSILRKVGKKRAAQSLMFAKLSPDASRVAYVSENNIYVEELATASEKALTTDGKDKLINGTFDWAYEEEFFCRDGFRWSPDSRSIAYWQINSAGTRNFYMLNNTDSVYPKLITIEYPKVGQPISASRIGIVNVSGASTKWMNILAMLKTITLSGWNGPHHQEK